MEKHARHGPNLRRRPGFADVGPGMQDGVRPAGRGGLDPSAGQKALDERRSTWGPARPGVARVDGGAVDSGEERGGLR
jgi:hypothetical protein